MAKPIKFVKYLKYLFIIIFIIPTLIGLVGTIKYVDKSKIVKNGIETEGKILNSSSSVTINDVSYYKLQIEYMDQDRETHIAWTGEDYTSYEFEDLKYIIIKYDPNTFEISKPNIDASSYSFYFVFLSIFGTLTLITLAFLIKNIVMDIKEAQVKRHGIETDAKFVLSGSNLKVNDVPYYYIKYSFVDNTGKEHEKKTRSIYKSDEADFFQVKETFRIRYSGNCSVITEQIDTSIISKIRSAKLAAVPSVSDLFEGLMSGNGIAKVEQPEELLKICLYCGSQVDEDTPICPHCSANEFKYVAKKKTN